jgi:hypothetical protein
MTSIIIMEGVRPKCIRKKDKRTTKRLEKELGFFRNPTAWKPWILLLLRTILNTSMTTLREDLGIKHKGGHTSGRIHR